MQRTIKIFGRTIDLALRNEGDYAVANELFLDHQYRFCDDVIRRAKHSIIDIGGHLGFFSIMAATLNPTVPIYAFEAHAGNFKLLKENLKANRIKNVTPKQLAVSNTVGQTQLILSQEDLNHSLEHAIEPTGQIQPVQTITLERIFTKNRLDRVDLLKLDCEGSEFKIIYSAPKEIFSKIDNIFLEYHNWVPNENSDKLKNHLANLGYTVQKFPNPKMPELGFLWCTK
jgi:FkbM family methyltransferase